MEDLGGLCQHGFVLGFLGVFLFVCLFGVVLGIEPRALAMSAKGITA
jgi:hypothetical protein